MTETDRQTDRQTDRKQEAQYQYMETGERRNITTGIGDISVVAHRTRDRKVEGSSPHRSGGRIFFSRVNFLCWLLFRHPLHPRVTAVARKRSRSFCQKCRLRLITRTHVASQRLTLSTGAWLYGVHRTRLCPHVIQCTSLFACDTMFYKTPLLSCDTMLYKKSLLPCNST